MKKGILLVILLLVSSNIFAQNLTFNECIELLNKKSWEQIDSYLDKKGWTYHDSSTEDDQQTVSWAYKKKPYKKDFNLFYCLYYLQNLQFCRYAGRYNV